MQNSSYILLFLLLLSACGDVVTPLSEETDGEMAMVSIRVSTRANDGTDTNIDDDEGIKALRIIVVDKDWKIIENWYQENLGGTSGMTETQTVTLRLPRQEVRFLAIANEKSMNRSFDTATLMADLGLNYEQNGLKEIFNRAWDDADPAFPKTASQYITYEDADNTIPVSTIGQYGLPMTGVRGASDIFTDQGNGETHHDYNNMLYEDIDESPIDLTSVSSLSLEMPLVRCVSKVVVKVTNAMDEDLNIYSVRFGRFFANKVYYYAHDPLHMPGETGLANWIFRFAKNSPIQLTSGTEDQTVFIGYIYPTSLPREEVTNPPYRYSIALESNVNATSTYTVFLSKDQNAETTDIGRNKLVVIDCTVNVHSMQIDELQLIVLPWDEADENNIIFD